MNENLYNLYSINTTIFDFIDYRDYLNSLLTQWKLSDPNLTHRKICNYFGFKSPNFFLLVTQKKRKILVPTAKSMAKKLSLTKKQTEYFVLLVRALLTKNLDEREEISKRTLSIQRHSQQKNLDPHLYELYEHWYQVILREVLSLPNKSHKAEDLAVLFDEPVSTSQIQKSLDQLKKLNLIEQEGVRWVPKDVHLKTGDTFSNTSIVLFHQKMLDLAKRSLSQHSGEQRYLSTLTLPVSPKSEKKIRELIDDFKAKALEISEMSSEDNDRVMQLNLQLFPMTKVPNEKK